MLQMTGLQSGNSATSGGRGRTARRHRFVKDRPGRYEPCPGRHPGRRSAAWATNRLPCQGHNPLTLFAFVLAEVHRAERCPGAPGFENRGAE